MHWRIYERGMEFGWLFIIIFSVLIILGIAHLVNLVVASRRKGTYGESPLHVLKRRYAKGEITKEDFEKMKRDLTKK
ncbi:MAG: SHOCT domain-containing protein [Nitrospirae bacterium]|nr:SHOCT domain-containing protein [Nitrospirota bacterium]MCL5238828.1 SHOCT domain-containing protein [Nitrospirota bacterium]